MERIHLMASRLLYKGSSKSCIYSCCRGPWGASRIQWNQGHLCALYNHFILQYSLFLINYHEPVIAFDPHSLAPQFCTGCVMKRFWEYKEVLWDLMWIIQEVEILLIKIYLRAIKGVLRLLSLNFLSRADCLWMGFDILSSESILNVVRNSIYLM